MSICIPRCRAGRPARSARAGTGRREFTRIACQRRHYRYSGHQRSWSGQLAQVIHRDGQAKTTVSGDWRVSDSDAPLNQRPLRPQLHRTHTWRLGITHRRILPGAADQRGALVCRQGEEMCRRPG
ncbi:ShlB/FhaC/HecB family hemolysin secretion/activation protein [Sodalis glossinidius]|uniref:ShlB/FhaC/HecB family hemolysin secretion/activation protein n=1 Tax=Sodalis glossinidius TaxID=63612 RepID=UPI001305234A